MTTEQATPEKAPAKANQRTLVGRVVSDRSEERV